MGPTERAPFHHLDAEGLEVIAFDDTDVRPTPNLLSSCSRLEKGLVCLISLRSPVSMGAMVCVITHTDKARVPPPVVLASAATPGEDLTLAIGTAIRDIARAEP